MNNGYMPLRDKSVTLMRFYGFPHHGDRFFAGALNDALPVFPTTGTDPSHPLRMTFNISLIMTFNISLIMTLNASLIMTPYRLIQGSWSRPLEGAVAHAVRLRILACRNDLNRKRIVSLQLTAHS